MDEVLHYMVNREWENDDKEERKLYLLKIARESRKSGETARKIGGMLLYNQIIEQLLREIIVGSVGYIKAEIWPATVQLKFNMSKTTLGGLINLFEQYAIKEQNQKLVIEYLKKYVENRNVVVHNLFGVNDLEKVLDEIEQYDELAEEIINLLLQYYGNVCEEFYDLERRVDFEDLFDSFGKDEY